MIACSSLTRSVNTTVNGIASATPSAMIRRYSVVAPRIIEFDIRRRKNLRSKFEIKAAPRKIVVAFLRDPIEGHVASYTCIYTKSKPRCAWLTRVMLPTHHAAEL